MANSSQSKPKEISRSMARANKANSVTNETFTETTGTIFYRRRTSAKEIMETLALIAEGDRISSLSRVKGYKEDTILDWVKAAGEHAQVVEAVLLADYGLDRGQIDGLWSYVGHQGEKKL